MALPGILLAIIDITVAYMYTHRAIFQDFECEHGLKKSQAHAREARKMHFCTLERVFAHAH